MSDHKRILTLILIMTAVVIVVAYALIYLFYNTVFGQQLAPFVRAAIVIGCSLILALIMGGVVFIRIKFPLIGNIEKSEARLKAVVETAVDGIITINDQGTIESFNSAAEHIFGYSLEEVIGQNVKMLMPKPFHGEHDTYLQNYLRTGKKKVIGIGREVFGRHKDGTKFPLELAVSEVRLAKQRMFSGIVRDITKRKQAEERQAQLLAELNIILSSIGDALICMDNNLNITRVNPSFLKLVGKKEEEVLGKSCRDVLKCMIEKERDSCAIECSSKKTLGKGTESNERFVIQNSEGKMITIESINSPLMDSEGKVIGSVKAMRDISKEVEIDRMKTEFISTVSHELRTPLTSIEGYIDLILDGDTGEINELQREFLGIVFQSAERLENLINDLLDVEKIESGKIQMNLEEISLSNIVNTAVKTMKPAAEKKGLKLISEIGEGIEIYGDSDRMIQVLTNLISNAIKFTKVGKVTVKLKLTNGNSETIVQDTGVGISRSDQKKLFTKFFRANDEYAREAGGTGLGLSIVKNIVEKCGGEIRVKSELNKGSEFRVIIPLGKRRKKQKVKKELPS